MNIDIKALILAVIMCSPLLFLIIVNYQNIEGYDESMIVVKQEVNKAIKENTTAAEKVILINHYCELSGIDGCVRYQTKVFLNEKE